MKLWIRNTASGSAKQLWAIQIAASVPAAPVDGKTSVWPKCHPLTRNRSSGTTHTWIGTTCRAKMVTKTQSRPRKSIQTSA